MLKLQREALKKTLDFSQVVSLQTKLKAQEKKQESILRNKSASSFKTPYTSQQESTNFSIQY